MGEKIALMMFFSVTKYVHFCTSELKSLKSTNWPYNRNLRVDLKVI